MENPQHIRFEQYLDGTMPPEARAAFEAELADNPALAQSLRLHEAARATLEVGALLDRRDRIRQRGERLLLWKKWQWKIQDVLETLFVQERADHSRHPRWGLIGGLSLATALLVLYLINPELFFPIKPGVSDQPIAFTSEQAQKAYSTYFKPIDLSSTLGGAEPDSLFQLASNQYSSGNYTEALGTLQPLLADTSFERRPLALLMQGICLLKTDDATAALESLDAVPPAAARLYQEAQWYRALALLKLGRSDEAVLLFREIAGNTQHRHKTDAAALLDRGR